MEVATTTYLKETKFPKPNDTTAARPRVKRIYVIPRMSVKETHIPSKNRIYLSEIILITALLNKNNFHYTNVLLYSCIYYNAFSIVYVGRSEVVLCNNFLNKSYIRIIHLKIF